MLDLFAATRKLMELYEELNSTRFLWDIPCTRLFDSLYAFTQVPWTFREMNAAEKNAAGSCSILSLTKPFVASKYTAVRKYNS